MKNNSYEGLTDINLFRLIGQGNEAAYTELYHRYKGVLYVHAYKMLRDRDEAKDVIQEVFTRFWYKRSTIDLTGSLKSYLYKAVTNRIRDIILHEKVVKRHEESLQSFIDKGEFITDNWIRERELIALIEQEVSKLPLKMREVFELSRSQNKSYSEIASELQISENTVKKHISKALKKLRPKLIGGIMFPFALLIEFFASK